MVAESENLRVAKNVQIRQSCSQTRKQLKVQNLSPVKLDDTCTCYSFKPFKNITDSSTSSYRRVPRDSHYLLTKTDKHTQIHILLLLQWKPFKERHNHFPTGIKTNEERGFHAEIKASRFGLWQKAHVRRVLDCISTIWRRGCVVN